MSIETLPDCITDKTTVLRSTLPGQIIIQRLLQEQIQDATRVAHIIGKGYISSEHVPFVPEFHF